MSWRSGAWRSDAWAGTVWYESVAASASASGTIFSETVESDIVTGGKTLILTLTGETWVASGATFDAQRQAIIDGLDSDQSETNGWNAEVRDKEVVTSVVRTSDTVVTITFSAAAAYSITNAENIVITIPGAALTGGSPLGAAPSIGIQPDSAGAFGTFPSELDYFHWRNKRRLRVRRGR